MAALPFRSTAFVFDKDAFAKFNQGPDEAESIRMADDVLSANGQRLTTYDESSLRKVMGISEPRQCRAKSGRDATGPKQEQISQVTSGAEPGIVPPFNTLDSKFQTMTIHNKPNAQSNGSGEKAKVDEQKNMESRGGNVYSKTPTKRAPVEGNINNNMPRAQFNKVRQQENKMQRKNLKAEAKSPAQSRRGALNNIFSPLAITQGSPLYPGTDSQEITSAQGLERRPGMQQHQQQHPGITNPQLSPAEVQARNNAMQAHLWLQQAHIWQQQATKGMFSQQDRQRAMSEFLARKQRDIMPHMPHQQQQVPDVQKMQAVSQEQAISDDTVSLKQQQMQQQQATTGKSEALSKMGLVATYTISEDDTVSESERQKRRFIALQRPGIVGLEGA